MADVKQLSLLLSFGGKRFESPFKYAGYKNNKTVSRENEINEEKTGTWVEERLLINKRKDFSCCFCCNRVTVGE